MTLVDEKKFFTEQLQLINAEEMIENHHSANHNKIPVSDSSYQSMVNALGKIFFLINLFIYFWLRWVFVAVHGLSLVVASGGHSSLRWVGFSLWWLLLLRSRAPGAWVSVVVAWGLQSAGSAVVAHGLSCSMACGIFPDQGSNPCPLHWQADSQPLYHQGSPIR